MGFIPSSDVFIVSLTARFAICTETPQIVSTVCAWAQILIGIAPRVNRYAFQVSVGFPVFSFGQAVRFLTNASSPCCVLG